MVPRATPERSTTSRTWKPSGPRSSTSETAVSRIRSRRRRWAGVVGVSGTAVPVDTGRQSGRAASPSQERGSCFSEQGREVERDGAVERREGGPGGGGDRRGTLGGAGIGDRGDHEEAAVGVVSTSRAHPGRKRSSGRNTRIAATVASTGASNPWSVDARPTTSSSRT